MENALTWKKSTMFAMKLKAGQKELQCVLLKFHRKTMMMSITYFTWYWVFSLEKKNFSIETLLQKTYLAEGKAWYLKMKILLEVPVTERYHLL